MKEADLHVHTTHSDGTYSPQEVVRKANELKLACIAIADHDCVDGIEPALEEASRFDLEVIPAVELSTQEQDSEVHILGYFINYKDQDLKKSLSDICKTRLDRISLMIEKLKKYDINLNIEDVLQLGGCGSIGRLHLAQVMVKKGFVKSTAEAFRRFIGDKAPCYAGRFNLTPKDAIAMIRSVGGISVLAHPYLMGKDNHIPAYIEYGLIGIEAYHTDHPPSIVEHYINMAKRYNLLVTGGSDCHGLGKGKGPFIGRVRVPYELVERLKQCKTTMQDL